MQHLTKSFDFDELGHPRAREQSLFRIFRPKEKAFEKPKMKQTY